jgi:hypothetical protein
MSKMLRNYQYLVGTNPTRSYESESLKEYIEGEVAASAAALINLAPEDLDTIGELAEAMQNNPDFLTTLQGRDADLLAAIGIAAGAQEMGAMTTPELPDNVDAKALFEAIGEAARRLREGLGVAQGASDMGTFTGSVITDNASVKTALQELETYAEANSAAAVEAALDARLDVLEADPTTKTYVDGADSALSGRLDVLEADATTAAAVAAVQSDVDQNEADSDAADAALSLRLDALEVDPTTAAAVAAVQADVDQNELDADAADLALSGRLDALELDPTTATAVAAVQADVDQNESDADAADAALSGRLDVLEADPTTQTAVNNALALKADLASPTLTGTPAAPTAAAGTNTTQVATTAFVSGAIADLVDGAPGTIDTLNEIATALGNDANLSTTLTNSIAAVQADVDQNELDSDAAEAALSGRLDALEADPTTATSVAAEAAHIDNLVTLSGVAEDSTDLGTFTGSTIADGSTVKAALQSLETNFENFDAAQGVADIVDGTTNFTGFKLQNTTVLATGAELNYVDGVTSNIQTQIDDANSAATAGAAANEVHIDNLATLSGVAKDETDLATFTGATIADNSTIKAALQALETKVEAVQADVDQNESDADAAIAAVQSDVDQNESDADAAIALKADIASPTFTGTPSAPTAGAGTNTTQLATTAFVSTAVANLIDSAPGALDTLNELAAAIGDDANFSTTITNSIAAVQSDVDQNELDADNAIALKLDASAASAFGLTLIDDADAATARGTLGLGSAATTASTDYATAAQGSTADAALPASSVSAFGLTLVDDADAATARTTLGLGTAATTASTDYATAAQGALADTAVQPAALNLKADLASPALTGTPTAPTAAADTNTTQIATTAYVQTEISDLIGDAPAGLNTLGEISDALNDDINALSNATTLINANETHIDALVVLSGVAKDAENLGTFTGSTIADNQTVKAGLQALETQLEANHAAAALRTALGITENAGDPADGRGMYYDTVASKYLLSS